MPYAAHLLEFPEGYDSSGFGYRGSFRRGWYYGYYGMDERLAAPTMTTSILERNLMVSAFSSLELDRRSYVAVVEVSSEVPLGTKGREEGSYHVIRGSW